MVVNRVEDAPRMIVHVCTLHECMLEEKLRMLHLSFRQEEGANLVRQDARDIISYV